MSDLTLFAVVLAAGAATRFGDTKQLADYRGASLVQRAVRNAETVCGPRTVLLTGSDWQRVAAACEPLAGFFACNPDFSAGMSSSLGAGVACVSESADALLLMLADQPLVTVQHLQDLAAHWRRRPEMIVATAFAGLQGPPVVFPRRYFTDLQSLSGDRGARTILERYRHGVLAIRFEAAAIDIDRPADLAGL